MLKASLVLDSSNHQFAASLIGCNLCCNSSRRHPKKAVADWKEVTPSVMLCGVALSSFSTHVRPLTVDPSVLLSCCHWLHPVTLSVGMWLVASRLPLKAIGNQPAGVTKQSLTFLFRSHSSRSIPLSSLYLSSKRGLTAIERMGSKREGESSASPSSLHVPKVSIPYCRVYPPLPHCDLRPLLPPSFLPLGPLLPPSLPVCPVVVGLSSTDVTKKENEDHQKSQKPIWS